MRAISYDDFGGPEQLRLSEVPIPVVGPGEVLIETRRAAVNPVDWKILSGGLTALMPHHFPIVPGWDVAGVVAATGPDTPEFTEGDEVMAYARKDVVQAGTFAEYVAFSVRGVARKPAALDWDTAAALPLAGGTALRVLRTLDLGPDDILLVHAAAGGVGTLASQIARTWGARVIGTASEGNHGYLRDLGVEPVAYGEGLVERVRELAPGGVTAVADLVGGVLDETEAVLARDGRHASIADPEARERGGSWVWVRPDGEALTELAGLVESGSLRVPIAETFGLAEVADAFRRSQDGHVRGKITVRVRD